MDIKKGYVPVKRDVLCNIITEFGILMKLVKPMKLCLN